MAKIWRYFLFSAYGRLSSAAFLICVFSGVLLAVPYDVSAAYASIRTMILLNVPATFIRNFHYWSAQLFLVFLLLHIWQHLRSSSEAEQKTGVWFRLTISLVFSLYVMLSGFILRGDDEAIQARRIFESFLAAAPFIGESLRYLVFGSGDSLQLTYVHHIATATLFLMIVIREHAHTLWTGWRVLLKTTGMTFILSLLLMAPLHDGYDPVVKGPWYFLGLQEILHYFSGPEITLIGILSFLALLFVLKWMNPFWSRISKMAILAGLCLYLVFTVIAVGFRGENWKWVFPPEGRGVMYSSALNVFVSPIPYHPSLLKMEASSREGCQHCHHSFTGFSPSHDPSAIGCVSCHGGNPLTLFKKQAHQGMILIPGNLSNASRACGTADCHPALTARVQGSIMTTCSGIVSVDRFVFGEQNTPDSLVHIADLGFSAADRHLRNLCAGCHLGRDKTETGHTTQLSRGGGCLACHLNHNNLALQDHKEYLENQPPDSLPAMTHPALNIRVGDGHCFGCHSRSGRIATNYQGWNETLFKEDSLPPNAGSLNLRVIQDKRVFEYAGADVHFQRGLECIDCHGSYELMGDGNLYMHKEGQLDVQCIDCHSTGMQDTVSLTLLRDDDARLAVLRKLDRKTGVLYSSVDGNHMITNLWPGAGGKRVMQGKNTGWNYSPKNAAEACSAGKAHDALECRACHTAWAPQCIGCHNTFEPGSDGFDHLDQKTVKGKWVEYAGKFMPDPPSLGVILVPGSKSYRVGTFVPGMILSIDKSGFTPGIESGANIFHRLYAPVSAHTITRKGRDCVSCHCDPLALGYGRGALNYLTTGSSGRWEFIPRFANNENDGLPEDAWTGFLAERKGIVSTRTNARPFNLKEQQRILLAGACLKCHSADSQVMKQSLYDFDALLRQVSPRCKLPAW